MKSAFDRLNLRPFERRLVVGVGTVVFIVLNLLFVWPHFKDRGRALDGLETARTLQAKFGKEIDEMPDFQRKVRALESEAEPVPPEDQGLQFLRTIQTQATQSGVTITGTSRETIRTNSQFFVERSQTVNLIAGEEQLVDFLYRIGAAGSMVRARALSLRPDAPRQHLSGTVTLVASFQKKSPPKSAAAAPPAASKPASKSVDVKPAQKPASKAAGNPTVKPADKARPPAKTEPAAPGGNKPAPGAAKSDRVTNKPAGAAPAVPAPPRPKSLPPIQKPTSTSE